MFCSRMHFWGAWAIFAFFHNGWLPILSFPLTPGKPKTQTLWGLVIGSFALGCAFRELEPFFPFSIMADSNFPFLFTLRKLKTQTLGGVSNWEFCSRMHFWELQSFFPFFIMVNSNFLFPSTLKIRDPNFRGLVIGSNFAYFPLWLTPIFGATAIFPILHDGQQ